MPTLSTTSVWSMLPPEQLRLGILNGMIEFDRVDDQGLSILCHAAKLQPDTKHSDADSSQLKVILDAMQQKYPFRDENNRKIVLNLIKQTDHDGRSSLHYGVANPENLKSLLELIPDDQKAACIMLDFSHLAREFVQKNTYLT